MQMLDGLMADSEDAEGAEDFDVNLFLEDMYVQEQEAEGALVMVLFPPHHGPYCDDQLRPFSS